MKEIGSYIYKMERAYDYKTLEMEIKSLKQQYSFLKVKSIGMTVQGRTLYCITLGSGKRKVHVNASHHANEWITSAALMKNIRRFCEIISGEIIDVDGSEALKNAQYDFVPMVNPDGVEICIHGLVGQKNQAQLYEANENSMDFSKWRSNGRGVDLNRNYDAGFALCKELSGLTNPSYGYYQGEFPLSENESHALVVLTQEQQYDLVIAYHTQGEEIYWQYGGYVIEDAAWYAKAFSEASGYKLGLPEPGAIAGGYKDWFIEAFKKPGFTIECGWGTNPIEITQLPTIVEKTRPIIYIASKKLVRIN